MNSLFGNWTSTLGKYSLPLVLSVLLPAVGISSQVSAAERVYASYSALERSISVDALEKYAKNGEIGEDLAVYTRYLKPEQLQELRRVLISPIEVNSVAVSQFLYTPQGEFLLKRLGEIVKTESRKEDSGFHALRSALILASSDKEGFTLLNLLRKYPGTSVHINLARTLSIAAELEKLVNETNRAVEAVSQKSSTEAATNPKNINVKSLPSLRRPGRFKVSDRKLKVFDSVRNRLIITQVYLPSITTPAPAIVISHGLGSDSTNFRYLAERLASHGFAVIVPNHPGSDTKQLRSLLDGSASELVTPEEFYHRPLDIKYVLDHLEGLNKEKSEYTNRLNLEQVGVFGHSFGGYTALALAGAEINYAKLRKDCQEEVLKESWNMSLIFQCRASNPLKEVLQVDQNLRDERVKAVVAVNPITSSLFGKEGLQKIQTPVMIVASSDDTITPALYEQILPFSWISNSQRYLALLTGATHFSAIGSGSDNSSATQLSLPSEVIGVNPAQARYYMKALSVPFFQTYVGGKSDYISYLNASYVKTISSSSVEVNLIKSLSATEIAKAIKNE
ncbi:MAG: alpha/beta hydrolase [Cyanobacteria bacterium P01_A01_bin.45]